MKPANDFSMFEYLKARDKGDNRPLISYYNNRIATNGFFSEVDKVANALYSMGLKAGDNIALCLPNIPNAIVIFYAGNKLGIAINLIHPLVPTKALVETIEGLNSKAVFVLDSLYNAHRMKLKQLNVQTIVCKPSDYLKGIYKFGYDMYTRRKQPDLLEDEFALFYNDFIKNQTKIAPSREHFEGIGEEIAAYIHSGGTTGIPKTAMIPNRALNECSYSIRTLIGDEVEKGESMLMVLPMFHIFGLGVCMHSTLTAGARCILVPIFKPKSLARVVRREKATYMTGVPSMYEKLAKVKRFGGRYLAKMKCCYCGGDKLKQEIKENFDKIMKKYNSSCTLCEGYGLTEAGVCNVNVEEIAKISSVGRPLGDIKVCIVDNDKNKLENGERGEICLSGDNLMSGYYNDPQTTEKALFKDKDGVLWLATGDYGYLEDSGHLFFLDRLKRMIKISGMNVFPNEIEYLVGQEIKEIDRCCAVDYQKNGKPFIKLFVTMKEGYTYSALIEQRIRQTIKANLMKYSLPKEIECVSELPLTAIGKVDYNKLKEKGVSSNDNQ
ncbi:MAG: acyl--CoA ligase [Clostridia bacterium]|nr:acyl--CoA ligase [Clostridia bacterium]